jgi:hypothetical protein
MAGQAPAFIRAWTIERRARKISDPIERLRYLRQATTAHSGARLRFRWRWMASLVLGTGLLPLGSDATHRNLRSPGPPAIAVRPQVPDYPNVWPVEQTNDFEVYSNGLRVEDRLAIANEPRSYSLIHRGSEMELGPRRDQPAGIVFHTTESDLAPFEPGQKRVLARLGKDLLLYVRRKQSYHFVIDRFGRVHRIVAESDTANHAGHSVWADSRWLYVDLNASFLGVAFEAQMQSDPQPINAAQLHAGKVLTEMLRSRYKLPLENCVTHAQVSVNPDNMRIGWHTDWGSGFPFQDLGLPDNYAIPNPSLYLFGFAYDPVYMKSTGSDLWRGLERAEEQMRETSAEHGLTMAQYRKLLQQKFRGALDALRRRGSI